MPKTIFAIFDEDEAARLFNSGESIRTIAKILHMERPRVSRLIKERGALVTQRAGGGRPFEYEVNHSAFNQVTDASAYWAGFIMADGCITDDGQIVVTLSDKDENHLNKLAEFMGTVRPLYYPSSNGYSSTSRPVTLSVRSKPMVDALRKYGLTPAKTHTARATELVSSNNHFWRGVLDGDGYISAPGGHLNVELVGSANICQQFASFVAASTGVHPLVHQHKSIYRVRVAKRAGLKLLDTLLYSSSISLDRKRSRAVGHLTT